MGVEMASATFEGAGAARGLKLAICNDTPRSESKRLAPLDALATNKASFSMESDELSIGAIAVTNDQMPIPRRTKKTERPSVFFHIGNFIRSPGYGRYYNLSRKGVKREICLKSPIDGGRIATAGVRGVRS